MEQKDRSQTYIAMMKESLKKEVELLQSILRLTEEQKELLLQGMDVDKFDNLVEKKGVLIEELSTVSDGFERLYQRVEDTLLAEKGMYRDEIRQIQQLIKQISELSAAIQTQEHQNNVWFQSYLEDERKVIRDYHVNNRTASAYYQNMRDVHRSEKSYFFDKIK